MIAALAISLLVTITVSNNVCFNLTKHNNFQEHLLNGCSDEKDNDFNTPSNRYYIKISNYSYFENLNYNFGNNQTNSTCGYVALAMLLSYYDNCLNDSIVGNGYEVSGSGTQSDGTLHEPDNNSLSFNPDSVSAYYTFLRSYKNTSLHAYLILKDKDALFNNPPVNYMASTYKAEFGTNEYDLQVLAQSYLYDIGVNQYCNIIYNESYGTSYTMDDIVYEIIDEIDSNRPVLWGFKNHARIVYGYQIDFNGCVKFYCHNGYINQNSIEVVAPSENSLPNAFPGGVGYVSLHFNFPSN